MDADRRDEEAFGSSSTGTGTNSGTGSGGGVKDSQMQVSLTSNLTVS